MEKDSGLGILVPLAFAGVLGYLLSEWLTARRTPEDAGGVEPDGSEGRDPGPGDSSLTPLPTLTLDLAIGTRYEHLSDIQLVNTQGVLEELGYTYVVYPEKDPPGKWVVVVGFRRY